MKKITSLLVFMLLSTLSSMASTAISTTFGAWDATVCTVSGNTLTFGKTWTGAGVWMGSVDYSSYDYLWVEFNSTTCAFTLDTQYNGTDGKLNGSYDAKIDGKAGDLIAGVALNSDHSDAFAQYYLQNHELGTLDVKAAYVGTKEEFEAAKAGAKQPKLDLSLANLGTSGWNKEYVNPTITITDATNGGGCGWWLSGVDYSDFDQVVVNFATATPINGQIIIQYAEIDPTTKENYFTSQPFDAGATQVISTMNTTYKNKVNQIYIQAFTAGSFTLASAYVATSDYVTGIKSATVDNANAEVVGTNYYTIGGEQTNGLQQGLNIVSKKLSNGKTISNKVLVK